jgi:lactate dehydrogenase-like 2-hydroxyacid dehydrogenase
VYRAKIRGEYVSLDELFAKSDVIALHCPLFPETEGIINQKSPLSKFPLDTLPTPIIL